MNTKSGLIHYYNRQSSFTRFDAAIIADRNAKKFYKKRKQPDAAAEGGDGAKPPKKTKKDEGAEGAKPPKKQPKKK